MKLYRFNQFESKSQFEDLENSRFEKIPDQIESLDLEYSVSNLAKLSSTLEMFSKNLKNVIAKEKKESAMYGKEEILGRIGAIESYISFIRDRGWMIHQILRVCKKLAASAYAVYERTNDPIQLARAVTFKQLWKGTLLLYRN